METNLVYPGTTTRTAGPRFIRPLPPRRKTMVHSVFSRFPHVATVLMLVMFATSVELQPDSALAALGEGADLGPGVVSLADDSNGDHDENRNNTNDENTNDENRNHDDDGNNENQKNGTGSHGDDNGNHDNGNAENRASDAGPQIASAGNGGVATASADGGVVFIGDVNSGGNAGNAIAVGDTTWGSVTVDGGNVVNSTRITVTADGGTGIADASGGNGNLAGVQE